MTKETKKYKLSLPDILLIVVVTNFFLLNFHEKVSYANIFLHLFSIGVVYIFAIFVFFLRFITDFLKKSAQKTGLSFGNNDQYWLNTLFSPIKVALIIYYFYFSSVFFSPELNAISASVYFVFSVIRLLTPSVTKFKKEN